MFCHPQLQNAANAVGNAASMAQSLLQPRSIYRCCRECWGCHLKPNQTVNRSVNHNTYDRLRIQLSRGSSRCPGPAVVPRIQNVTAAAQCEVPCIVPNKHNHIYCIYIEHYRTHTYKIKWVKRDTSLYSLTTIPFQSTLPCLNRGFGTHPSSICSIL